MRRSVLCLARATMPSPPSASLALANDASLLSSLAAARYDTATLSTSPVSVPHETASLSASPSSFSSDAAAPSLAPPQRALLSDALDRPPPTSRGQSPERSMASVRTPQHSPPIARLLQRSNSGREPIVDLATPASTMHVDLSRPAAAALPPKRVTNQIPPRRRASSDARHRANALAPDAGASVLDLIAGRGLARKRTMSISALPHGDAGVFGSPEAEEAEARPRPARQSSIDSENIIRRGSYVNADLEDASRRKSIDIPYPVLSTPSPAQWWQMLFGTANASAAHEGDSKRQLDDEDVSKGDEAPWERVRDHYKAPKSPMVLCHGLFGFDSASIVRGQF